ncbi:MAG: GNAT family N-acetyltransferase, partial [Candidatus Nanopelagicales bacterium]
MSIAVRDATVAYLPTIAAIYTHYTLKTTATFNIEVRSPREWRDRFQQHIVDGPYDLMVAEEDGAVVGFVETQRFRPKAAYDRSVEISVYASPDAQGRGVGALLFAALFARLEGDERFHRAFSIIALPNAASIALHERFGFVHRGTLTEAGFKFGQYLD